MKRDRKGRFTKSSRWEKIIGWSICIIAVPLIGHAWYIEGSAPVTYEAEVIEESIYPREVRIGVDITWTDERIEEEVRRVFPETPELAIAIMRCENGWSKERGYVVDQQSLHSNNGVQEPSWGLFQIHSPSWHNKAIELGLEEYKTDVLENLAMARHIYEARGNRWTDWTCYNKQLY